jgi:hypothetical protein
VEVGLQGLLLKFKYQKARVPKFFGLRTQVQDLSESWKGLAKVRAPLNLLLADRKLGPRVRQRRVCNLSEATDLISSEQGRNQGSVVAYFLPFQGCLPQTGLNPQEHKIHLKKA